MDNIEKFTDLLQGRLDEESERKLFSDMSIDDELRNDFKCFNSVANSIKQNMSAFAPGAALKSRVFARAGFALPAEIPVAQGQNVQPTASGAGFFRTKMFVGIASGAASAIVAILLTMSVMSSLDKNQQQTAINKSTGNPVAANIPRVESRSTNDNREQKVRTIVKYVYLKEKETAEMESNSQVDEQAVANISIPPQMNNGRLAGNRLYLTGSDIPLPGYDPIFKESPKDSRLSVEFRGSMNWNIPRENVSPAEYIKFNNLDLSLLYRPSATIKTGLNLRQESFYTVYESKESDGSVYRYMRQPNLTTLSGIIRLNPFEGSVFSPYCQLGIGINQVGFLASPSVGFEYMAYPELSFIMGFEYRSLWFAHQGKWFSAAKAGVNYGVSYKF
jgi:hypothetical protein